MSRLAQNDDYFRRVPKSVTEGDHGDRKALMSEKAPTVQAGNDGQDMKRTAMNENAIDTYSPSSPENDVVVPDIDHSNNVGGTELKENELAPDSLVRTGK
jgi:hypothetical protein